MRFSFENAKLSRSPKRRFIDVGLGKWHGDLVFGDHAFPIADRIGIDGSGPTN